ncbi:MAG TPA: YhcH/YjgK/YiaL family protein [Nitrospirota bacterium]|nr:YhcH/YjgK/YiaL family protein [Nitrospirota bacterium]
MVVTEIRHIDRQITMTADMQKALSFLRRQDIQGLAEGKIEIDGDRVFAMVQRYETIRTEVPKFECHRKYLDLQFILSGEEIIGWTPVERMTITEPYDAGRDICFGTVAAGKWSPMHLQSGQVAVLWPEDGHAPKLSAGVPASVMKIVVKVAL